MSLAHYILSKPRFPRIIEGLLDIYCGKPRIGAGKSARWIHSVITNNPEELALILSRLHILMPREDMRQQLYIWALQIPDRCLENIANQVEQVKYYLILRMKSWLEWGAKELAREPISEEWSRRTQEALDLRSVLAPSISSPLYGFSPCQRYMLYLRFHEDLDWSKIGRAVRTKRHSVKRDINLLLEEIAQDGC